jgi:hypothetical protein
MSLDNLSALFARNRIRKAILPRPLGVFSMPLNTFVASVPCGGDWLPFGLMCREMIRWRQAHKILNGIVLMVPIHMMNVMPIRDWPVVRLVDSSVEIAHA